MSDTQDDTGAKPTPSDGPWEAVTYHIDGHGFHDHTVDMKGWDCRIAAIEHTGEIGRKNAELIAAAGTAAHEAAEMGYDGQKAVEALPKLLGALRSIAAAGHAPHDVVQKANRALEGAEGSGDE